MTAPHFTPDEIAFLVQMSQECAGPSEAETDFDEQVQRYLDVLYAKS